MTTKPQHQPWVLVGNYVPDKQESMLRFAAMLERGLQQMSVDVILTQPCVVFGHMVSDTHAGWGKWLAYVDKWLFYPIVLLLLRYKYRDAWFHICDHSNAPYVFVLPRQRTSVTCHDVLAIQAAQGDRNTHIQTGRMGRLLQAYILSGLKACNHIAAVSAYTLRNLEAVVGKSNRQQQRRVIPNALNNDFHRLPSSFDLTEDAPMVSGPYILHVGSGHPRKNREALLWMLKALGNRWQGQAVFAGEPLPPAFISLAKDLGIADRVVAVVKPRHAVLNRLYNNCAAFIFPSYSEGFGWPLVEAQMCGAPVIANDIPVLREVSGGAALHVNASQPTAMAEAFLQLQNEAFRQQLIEKGLQNAAVYQLPEMTRCYLQMAGEWTIKGSPENELPFESRNTVEARPF